MAAAPTGGRRGGLHLQDDARRSTADHRGGPWDAHQEDSKALAIALVDTTTGAVAALRRDDIEEDGATRVDGAACAWTPPRTTSRRACGPSAWMWSRKTAAAARRASVPSRTLYVREGRALRPVLAGLVVRQWAWLRGNQPRCEPATPVAPAAIREDDAISIALGAPGPSGWRDLVLTATSKRSDHGPARKPLHVRVPADRHAYDLHAFDRAYEAWRR